MALPESVSRLLATGAFDGVEDAWLARLAEEAADVEFFADVAAALRAAGEIDQARFLVEMWDEHLRESDRHDVRLELLRRQGDLLHEDPPALHAAIVATLETVHREHEHFRPLAEKTGLFRAIEDIPKTWTKIEKLRDILPYRAGTIVWMEGKGAGRITEINLALDVFRVDLDRIGALSVGFAAAQKLLKPLPEGHVLRRRVEEPEVLVALKESDPAELARIALGSYPDPLTANELRQALAGIVEDDEWTSFWAKVRKNPHVVALPGKRQQYRWAESADAAVSSLRERFEAAGLDEQLDLWRSHAGRDPELKAAMAEGLRERARTLLADDPTRAFEVALALDREGVAEELTPAAILRDQEDPLRFVGGLSDTKARREAFVLLGEVRDDADALFARALPREEEVRILDFLSERLEQSAPDLHATAISELLNQPRANPAGFTWLAERAADDERLLTRNPSRLFLQILSAAGDDAFAAHKRRLLALADSGSTLPRLLPHLDADQAARCEETLDRALGFESYQRDLLRNAIHLRFPDLRQQEAPLYATAEAIAARREELRRLLEEEIPANRKAIEEARELGDLRENFEYKSARQRHEYLASLSTKLAQDLERARAIDFAQVDTSAIRVGTRARLRKGDEERSYAILGPWDSKPEEGVLSNESEMAGKLLGKAPRETVEIEGADWQVETVERFR